MEGYEVPPKLQEERQELEAAIAALRRKLKAIKVRKGVAWSTDTAQRRPDELKHPP